MGNNFPVCSVSPRGCNQISATVGTFTMVEYHVCLFPVPGVLMGLLELSEGIPDEMRLTHWPVSRTGYYNNSQSLGFLIGVLHLIQCQNLGYLGLFLGFSTT